MKKKNPLTYPEAREIRAYIKAASRGGAHKELRGVHKTLRRVAGTTARQLAEEARQEIPVGKNPLTRREAARLTHDAEELYKSAIRFQDTDSDDLADRQFQTAFEVHYIIKEYGPKRLNLSRLNKLRKRYERTYYRRLNRPKKNPRRNPLTRSEAMKLLREAHHDYLMAISFIKDGWHTTAEKHNAKADKIRRIIKEYGPKRLSLSMLDRMSKNYEKEYLRYVRTRKNPRRKKKNPLTQSEEERIRKRYRLAHRKSKDAWKKEDYTMSTYYTGRALSYGEVADEFGPKRNPKESLHAHRMARRGYTHVIILPKGMGEPLYTKSLYAAKEMAKEYGKGTRVMKIGNPRRKKKNPLTKEEVKEINWKAEMLGRQIPYMSGEGGSFYGGRRRGMMDVAKKYGPKGNPKRRPKRKLTEYIYGVMWADDYGIKVTETSKKRAIRLANQFRAVLKYPPCKVVVVRRIKKA